MNNTTTNNKRELFGTHRQHPADMRSIGALQSWDMNPRDDETKSLEPLAQSLAEDGQLDDVHVMLTLGAEVILRGHRRVRAMRELGWTECRQVAHKFSDLRDAYRFAIIDHGHTVSLNNNEKLNLVTNGMSLGLNGEDIAASIGVSKETVSKHYELALELPQGARSALADGRLSMHTAELLLEVPKEARRDATQMILKDMETGEPMAHGQAKAYIHAHYVLPAKWRKEWQVLEVKLKKTYKVAAGYHYVPWEDRLSYVMGDSGQPEPGWEHATASYPRDKSGRTVGEVAFAYDVPIYVVPAPLHREGYVAVVCAAMLRDAVAVAQGAKDEGSKGKDEEEEEMAAEFLRQQNGDSRMQAAQSGEQNEASCERAGDEQRVVDDRVGRWLRVWLSAIYEALLKAPTDVMTKEPWVPLREYLADLTTDVDAGALEAWQGITTAAGAVAWIEGDEKNRAHLRTTLMLLLCAAHDASGSEGAIRAVGAAMGVDAAAMDGKVNVQRVAPPESGQPDTQKGN
jgi:ParB/RepB/Spo0J family partition protein